MKTRSLLAVVFLVACNGESPTAPTLQQLPQQPPAASQTTSIWGYVHDSTGRCIQGAVVEVLDGPRAGAKATQEGGCSVWDYSGFYTFNELPGNSTIRLRASKVGYETAEATFSTSNGNNQSSILLLPE